MTTFSDAAFEKKLLELNHSQQSIQTLSLWLIHHRKHNQIIVKVWFRELMKAKPIKKLTFMYLANDVIQNSKKKGPEFPKEFATVLVKAFHHVKEHAVDEKTERGLSRLIDIWQERAIYDAKLTEELKRSLSGKFKPSSKSIFKEESDSGSDNKKHKSRKVSDRKKISESELENSKKLESRKPVKEDNSYNPAEVTVKKSKTKEAQPVVISGVIPQQKEDKEEKVTPDSPQPEPPDSGVLIKALRELENSASSDAAVRQKIASLPPEVSDVSLLEKVHNKREAEGLSQQVEEASDLLNDYNGRLQAELEERRQVATMLHDYIGAQRHQLTQSETRLEEYRLKLQKVTQVRNELRSHLQNLPDLTRLPDVTGGLAPLPSAGDLFDTR